MAHNSETAHLPYRPCVGVALFNRAGLLFVAERIDLPGSWQMPQGGIDPGESPYEAVYRELMEEIGTDKAEILDVMDEPLRYDLPDDLRSRLWGGQFRGQEQTWVAARFTGVDSDIVLDAHNPPEFCRWRWVEPQRAIDLIVSFKRDVYRLVLERFAPLSFSE